MTNRQIKVVELLFTLFVLNLFETSHNSTQAFVWLKETCIFMHKDVEIMQRLYLHVLQSSTPIEKISDELAYILHRTNQSINGIIKLRLRSRAQIYRRIKLYETKDYVVSPTTFSEEEARYAAEFLKAFASIGGMLDC